MRAIQGDVGLTTVFRVLSNLVFSLLVRPSSSAHDIVKGILCSQGQPADWMHTDASDYVRKTRRNHRPDGALIVGGLARLACSFLPVFAVLTALDRGEGMHAVECK